MCANELESLSRMEKVKSVGCGLASTGWEPSPGCSESDHMDGSRKPYLGPVAWHGGWRERKKHTCLFPARLFPAGLHLWAEMWEEF